MWKSRKAEGLSGGTLLGAQEEAGLLLCDARGSASCRAGNALTSSPADASELHVVPAILSFARELNLERG